jgi:hypothetical protein
VEVAQKRQLSPQAHGKWFQKLHKWQKALDAYEQQRAEPHEDPLENALNRMTCLEVDCQTSHTLKCGAVHGPHKCVFVFAHGNASPCSQTLCTPLPIKMQVGYTNVHRHWATGTNWRPSPMTCGRRHRHQSACAWRPWPRGEHGASVIGQPWTRTHNKCRPGPSTADFCVPCSPYTEKTIARHVHALIRWSTI